VVTGARKRTETEAACGEFVVRNRLGLHARAATKLVNLASRYPCDVFVSNEEQRANAKSVMGVLLLCGAQGTRLVVEAHGECAAQAVEEIGNLIAERFGEEK
jgi:phosphocarrier protein HPr